MAQTTSLVFNGGVIPSPSPAPSGSGKAKLLKIGEITVTEQEVQVTKNVICDPDSATTVAPFMEVLTSARLAELVQANNILVLDDGTMQYLMSDASIAIEEGTAVCTAVNFLGLSKENRAKVLYPCTRLTDELTLHQVIEVGEPVETGFDLVKAYPEDTEAGTLIDKLEIEDTINDDHDYQPLLKIVPTDGKVAINEDGLHEALDGLGGALDGVIETINELDMDSVPHAYLGSTLFQSAGDSVTTGTPIDVFSCAAPLVGDCFEFEQTTTIDDTPFGYVWIEPGTYLINASVTLQWVGNPRGTFVAKVGKVMGENVDFSQEQELLRSTTRIVTIPNRMKLSINITYDAGTPIMGFWIQSLQVVKLAGGMSQTTVAHGLSLEGNGSVENPLDISEHGLREAFNYAKDEEYFATKQEIAPLATKSALQAETARATQRENEIEELFTLPTQEAVDTWLNAHPEATTTVQDGSLIEAKFSDALKLKAIKDYVTPEMFGAKGDGVTDDSLAFADALATRKVLVLIGNYLIHGSFNVYNSIIRYDGIITIADNDFRFLITGSNFSIDGLQLFCNNKNSISVLYLQNCDNIIIRNCLLRDIGDGSSSQVGAVSIHDNCRNILIENCTFKNIIGAAGSVVHGVSVRQVVGESNEHITIRSCTFDTITPGDDADGVKVTGSVFADLNVNNCYFVGIRKRAMKFQATGCKSYGNTIVVKQPMFAVIDFQRGEGSSENDEVILDWDGITPIGQYSGLLYKCIGVSGSNVLVKGLQVLQKAQTAPNDHQFLLDITKLTEEVDLNNIKIVRCFCQGLAYALRVLSDITSVNDLELDVNFISNGHSGIITVPTTTTVSNSKLTMQTSGDYTTFFTQGATSFVRSEFDIIGAGYDIYTAKNYDPSMIVKFRTTSSSSHIRGYDWRNNHTTYYQATNNKNNHATSSARSMQRNCKVGDIAYLNTPILENGKIVFAYLCTEDGTDSQTGVFESIYLQ